MLGPADLWYKDAIVYSLNVETFQDSDGDGVGDFPGLTSRIDYLHALGVTCIWLLPFYTSPNRDNRYDVADHYGVDPKLGTLGDVVDFVRAARERGLRVMVDLVVNHTSDAHPWFQRARSDPRSRHRGYYVWADEPPPNAGEGMVFPGIESATWRYDEVAGAWYFHRFYAHQPDLDLANPDVRDEVRKIMGFWLEVGVSGFRVDAAPFLVEEKGVSPSSVERHRPHVFFRRMRDFLTWRRGDAALLAEANITAEEVEDYVGTGDRLHMLFNFFANQHLFLSLATCRAEPLARALRQLPPLPFAAQWANFLRNHDELDLARLTPEDRRLVYEAFAPDEDMRLYGRGIRRRLAPMLGGDRARIELAYSLLLALPGTPVLRYGDEIGMGDDLTRPERDSVRTPMQWSSVHNGGFSSAPEERLVRPMVRGAYGPRAVNVADQQRDPNSFLHWMQRALRVRQSCRELGRGTGEVLSVDHEGVLALRCRYEGATVFTLHNLSPEPCRIPVPVETSWRTTELFANRDYGAPSAARGEVELDGYGYRWFRTGESRRWRGR